MYEGNPVDLRMEKIISADGIFDEATRQCRVEKYDPEEDYIYLELKEDELTVISLDAKYRCYISTRTELLYCTGVRRCVSSFLWAMSQRSGLLKYCQLLIDL